MRGRLKYPRSAMKRLLAAIGSAFKGRHRSEVRPAVSLGPHKRPRVRSQRVCTLTAAAVCPWLPPQPCHRSTSSSGKVIVLLSSQITALKRLSNLRDTACAACTTTLLISWSIACKNWAHASVKRLSTAVSLTDTARTWAVEANCSKLACGCCWKPNSRHHTELCVKVESFHQG